MSGDAEAAGRRLSAVWRIAALTAVVAVIALLAYGLLTQGADPSIDEGLAQGEAQPAPDFDLEVLTRGTLRSGRSGELEPLLADDRLSSAELRGTPFVLNLWASWCIPCREEAPILADGWREHGPRGVLYLGLNMQDVTDDALDFIEEFDVRYPNIREPDNATARAYGATGIPETYFVSPSGRVVGHVIGVVTSEQLDAGARAAKTGDVVGSLTGGAQRPQR